MPLNKKVTTTSSRFRTRTRRKRGGPVGSINRANTSSTNKRKLITQQVSTPHQLERTTPEKQQQRKCSRIGKTAAVEAEKDPTDFCDEDVASSSSTSTYASPVLPMTEKEATGTTETRTKQIEDTRHNTSIPTSLSHPQPHQRSVSRRPSHKNAIAVDTRFLNTNEGRQAHDRFYQGVVRFLQSIQHPHDSDPSLISWTTTSTSTPSKGIKVNCCCKNWPSSSGEEEEEDDDDKSKIRSTIMHQLSCGTPIQPSTIDINKGTNSNDRSVTVQMPDELTASGTWTILGDLVEACVAKQKDGSKITDNHNRGLPMSPLKVTLFTSDTSSFLDPNDTKAHKRGMDSLWERVKPSFLNGTLQSIQIVIVKGVTIVASSNDDADEVSGQHDGPLPPENTAFSKQGFDHDDGTDIQDDYETLTSKREVEITALVKLWEGYFERKATENFMANRSHIQFEAKLRPRVDIAVYVIDADHVGFNRLLQKWMRDALLTTVGMGCSSAASRAWQETLHFQLPETTDFDACILSFQASYKNLPFPLNSPHTKALCEDMSLLSQAEWDILQLVPISSIDASLIYGVPIGLRAGLEENVDRHQEMSRLVQALFKHLGSKDCALVVRSRAGLVSPSSTGGLFHCAAKNQHFLLMPDMIESSTDCATASCTGILYRMVSPDSLLQETCPADILRSLNADLNDNNPFLGYIEASLDQLTCSSLNPLMFEAGENGMDELQPEPKRLRWCDKHSNNVDRSLGVDNNEEQPSETAHEVKNIGSDLVVDSGKGKKSIWNDDSGIGSLMKDPSRSTSIEPDGKDSRRGGRKDGPAPAVISLGRNLRAMNRDDVVHAHSTKDSRHVSTDITSKGKKSYNRDRSPVGNDSSDSSSDTDSSEGMFGTFQYTQ